MTPENSIMGYGVDSDGRCYMIEIERDGKKKCTVVMLEEYKSLYVAFQNVKELTDIFAIRALVKSLEQKMESVN